ncbi:pathogenesis-related protein PRB1-2-like [Gigantopelta aegis]|uniref:pathogenesis-related protein PRB1-2-like n=1 Tax=Gigantopelta aegis TaxID=1735272 RepID=UPI001B889007|nr:pathogenesis-related protein PRB1-2-like [Gigantopelta aegis]
MKCAVFLLTLWILAFSNGEMEDNSSTLQRSKRAGPKAFFYYYEKLAAVRKHNEKRRLPGASNMQIMYWDYVLENVAQGYANKCIYKHNPDRTTSQKKYSAVGENLFYTTGVRLTADDFVNWWYEEVSDYNYSDNTCTAGKACGHYTQVIYNGICSDFV